MLNLQLTLSLLAIYTALLVGVIAFVYSQVLIRPDHVLHRPFEWLRRKLTRIEIQEEEFEIPEELSLTGFPEKDTRRIETRHESPLLKPLGGCLLCTAGQFAFWFFLLQLHVTRLWVLYPTQILFTLINLIFSVCLSILTALLLQRLLQK